MKTPIRILLTLALSAGAALAQDDRKPEPPKAPDQPQRPERPNPQQGPPAEGRRPEGAPQGRDFNAPRDGERRPEARGPRDGQRGDQPQPEGEARDRGPQDRPNFSQTHRGFGQRGRYAGRQLMEQRFGAQRPGFSGSPAPQMRGGERGFGPGPGKPSFQRPQMPGDQFRGPQQSSGPRDFRGPGAMNAGPRPDFNRPQMQPPFGQDGPRHMQPDGRPPGPPIPPPFQ